MFNLVSRSPVIQSYLFLGILIITVLMITVNFLVLENMDYNWQFSTDSLSMQSETACRMLGPISDRDPRLIELIRRQFLFLPSSKNVPYLLRHEKNSVLFESNYKNKYPSWMLIDSYLTDFYPNNLTSPPRFFVEAGAYDGEYLSNTLRLEMEQGWTGLLVEPNSDVFYKLQKMNRKAWTTPTCLSPHPYPETVILLIKKESPGKNRDLLVRAAAEITKDKSTVENEGEDGIITLYETVQCLPLRSLLMAMNVTHVDFFSVDVEKVEEQVLDTFPLETITIDLLAIEHRREELTQKFETEELAQLTLKELITQNYSDEVIMFRKKLIEEFEDQRFIQKMISRGYYYLDSTCAFVNDYIFVRKASTLFQKLKVPRNQENRTEVCKFKHLHSLSVVYSKSSELRGPHHSPNLEYKDAFIPDFKTSV